MFDRRNYFAALLALVFAVSGISATPSYAAATVDRAVCSTADKSGGDAAVCSGTELIDSATQEIAKLYQGNILVVQSVGGTANAITGSTSPVATSLSDGEMRQIKPASNNTSTVTYNDNGLGAKQVVSAAGGALGAGDLQSTTVYILRYYAANDEWRVLTTLGTGTASASNAYVTIGNTGSLSDERALTAGTALTLTDGGAGSTATIALTDAELTCIAALTSASNKLAYYTGSGTCALTDVSSFARSIIDDADAATMRSSLGVVIGTDVQAYDADLSALAANSTTGFWAYTGAGTGAARTLQAPAAGLTISNPAGTAGNPTFALANDLASLEGASGTNTIYYRSGADTWSAVTIGGLLSFSGGSLNVGDAELSALAGLTSASDALPYFTGSGTAAVTTVSSYARTLIDDADAATARGTLGLTIGTNVQAYDADLTTWAGLTPSANAQSLVTAADYAAMRGLLDLEAGTDFYSISAADTAFLSPGEIDTSAELRGVLTDETGTGAAVFGTSPTFTTDVTLGSDTLSDFTGFGLALSGGALGIDTTGSTDEFCLTYEATGPSIQWQSCGGGGGGGSPGGSSGQIQFNNAGSFDGFTASGDATINTSTGAVTIANDAVTYAKMQNVGANSVLANNTSSSGDVAEVSLAASKVLGRGSTGNIAALTPTNGLSVSGTDIQMDVNGLGSATPAWDDKTPFSDTSASNASKNATLQEMWKQLRRNEFHKFFHFFTDFINETSATASDEALSETNSGTGAGTTAHSGSFGQNGPGIVSISQGTTSTGRAALMSSPTIIQLGGGELVFECYIYVQTASSSGQRYQVVAGLFDTNTAANQVDAVAFVYDEGGVSTGSTATANWQAVTSSNSTRTWNASASGSSSVTSDSAWKLKIVVNAAGTQADFYVNESLRYTHTTNIPTASGRDVGFGIFTIKSAGTTAAPIYSDYVMVDQEFTTAR